jgi:hypothetical protein
VEMREYSSAEDDVPNLRVLNNLFLTSPERQRFKSEERTTCHEDCAVQRIALCRRQKASNISRQPFRQRLRKTAN